MSPDGFINLSGPRVDQAWMSYPRVDAVKVMLVWWKGQKRGYVVIRAVSDECVGMSAELCEGNRNLIGDILKCVKSDFSKELKSVLRNYKITTL